MKRISFSRACVVAVVMIAAALAPASYAYVPKWDGGSPLQASFSAPTTPIAATEPIAASAAMSSALAAETETHASMDPLLRGETDVLTHQGISFARASQAIALQQEVARTGLANNIEAALSGAFAGMWFEPAAARFHIGVTSNASRQAARRIVAQAGLTASVVETPVRSTWAALVATQNWWNRRLAKLLASAEATTGLDSQRNAVSITLSSLVPLRERTALERAATIASVNVIVSIVPSSHSEKQANKKACENPFVSGKARCETTITSGVRIVAPGGGCTAGPMLINGNETYMLTAGHCFGKGSIKTGVAINEAVTSEYPSEVGGQQEIGSEGRWYENIERDIAEVKVKLPPGVFAETLPDPVPALMAEWGIANPSVPHTVTGIATSVMGETNCHEGQTSGERCGQVKRLNVKEREGQTEHLVEDSACGEGGDSGGPWFQGKSTSEVLMQGVHIAGIAGEKCSEGEKVTFYEPLLDLPGAAGYGILKTFDGQRLLTTANEVRSKIGPSWHHREKGGTGNGMKIQEKSPEEVRGEGGEQKLKGKIIATGVEILAESVQVKGAIYNNSMQGQAKLLLQYHGLSLAGKPNCVVKVGKNNTVHVFGHQAWKWNGEKKQLEGSQNTQFPGWIFLASELKEGATELPKETFTTLSFSNKSVTETCTFNNVSVEIKGSLTGEIKPSKLEEFTTEQTVTPRGARKQHFWNGKEDIGVETKLFIGPEKEEAELFGETKVKPKTQEVALFEF